MLAPGKHLAKLIDFGVSLQESNGFPQIWWQFQSGQETITHFGYTTPRKPDKTKGADEITLGVLTTLGWKGNLIDALPKLYDGPLSGVLNMTDEFELVVNHEVYEGTTRAKVAFVNIPGAHTGVGKKFENKGELMAAMAKMQQGGAKKEEKKAGDYGL